MGLGLFQRFAHDRTDGREAASALRAAAKTAIDGAGRACAGLTLNGRADMLVRKNIARANDHEAT
jgi:hypothetical protein